VTDIIYALKRLAMREGKVIEASKATALARSFVRTVDSRGRNHEPELLTRYYLKTNPFAILSQAPLGLKLLFRGRFPLGGEKIRGISEIRAIVAKSREIGGL
jgi:hypothetical protein